MNTSNCADIYLNRLKEGVVTIKKIFSCLMTLLIIFAFMPATTAINAEISAYSAITLEAMTGKALYEKNADDIRPMASTTKIMTALIAIESSNLESVFTVSKKAVSVEGSQLGLLEGDKIKLRDLLYMLMLKSANDAAETIAENIAGSTEKFADKMNERARQMGLTKTHFANPHGLPDDNHYTTARELALIAREALKNDKFKDLVSTHKVKLTYHNLVLENSNRLLEAYEYADGVKTGFTKKAGRCLVSSATKDGVTIINVTLNDGNDWNDHIALFNSNFNRVKRYKILSAGEYKITRPVLNGMVEAVFTNTEDVYGVEIDGKPMEIEYQANLPVVLYAPVDVNCSYGSLMIMQNEKMLTEVPLRLIDDIEQREAELSFAQKFSFYLKQLLNKGLF